MHTYKIDLDNVKDCKLFLDLPFVIYEHISQWVPPLEGDAKKLLSPQKHPFYQYGEAAFFITIGDNGKTLGRIAVLNNHNYNEFNHEKTAFFCLFESVNDIVVAKNLFQLALEWARTQGMNKLLGPKGFTALDGMGLLVKGFDHRPALGLPYNPPYYPGLLEAVGLLPCSEIVSGYLNANMQFPQKIQNIAKLVKSKRGMRVVNFKNRRDLKKVIPELQRMYNEILKETTGNIPLTDNDVKTMAQQILWFADPKLIKIITKDNLPIGFLMAYPDISAAIQHCRGRLFPFGWLEVLYERKKTRWVNINGAGIVGKFRGMGGTALLFDEMYKSIVDGGFIHAELVQVGVENEPMQIELKCLGVDFYKKHVVYFMDV